jgi:hypothetical protein
MFVDARMRHTTDTQIDCACRDLALPSRAGNPGIEPGVAVLEAVRAGRLPCHKVGRHIRFTRPMLDDWLAEQPRQ